MLKVLAEGMVSCCWLCCLVINVLLAAETKASKEGKSVANVSTDQAEKDLGVKIMYEQDDMTSPGGYLQRSCWYSFEARMLFWI